MSGRKRRPTFSTQLRTAREDWHAHVSSCRQCAAALVDKTRFCAAGFEVLQAYHRLKRRAGRPLRRITPL